MPYNYDTQNLSFLTYIAKYLKSIVTSYFFFNTFSRVSDGNYNETLSNVNWVAIKILKDFHFKTTQAITLWLTVTYSKCDNRFLIISKFNFKTVSFLKAM